MKHTGSARRTQAKSARRALDLLELLAENRDGLGFGDLALRLGLPKSSLHELLDVLVTRGYVTVDWPSRGYALGVRVWELGQAFVRYREMVGQARPEMEGVVRTLNETVQLSVLDGVENVYLAKVDCSHPVRLQSEVGKRLPAHATGLGKVLLAFLLEHERHERLRLRPLERFTEFTITDVDDLEAELALIRERGFAIDDQEYTPGLRCVAVPVRDHTGAANASISASIPIMRANTTQLAKALKLLAEASLEIAIQIGCQTIDSLMRSLQQRSAAELEEMIAMAMERSTVVGIAR